MKYSFAAEEEEQNGVVVKVLQVLTALVKYGYYDDAKDIEQLLPAIHELLDGQDDYPTRESKLYKEGMYVMTVSRLIISASFLYLELSRAKAFTHPPLGNKNRTMIIAELLSMRQIIVGCILTD